MLCDSRFNSCRWNVYRNSYVLCRNIFAAKYEAKIMSLHIKIYVFKVLNDLD